MPILKPGNVLAIDNKAYIVTTTNKLYDDCCSECDRNGCGCDELRSPKTGQIVSCAELIGDSACLKEVKEGV